MEKNKTLIFGTMYLYNHHMGALVSLWIERAKELKREWLLIDSASPKALMKKINFSGGNLIRFNDNIGHLSAGGDDGWGRAFCAGLERAIDGGYENIIHIESDLLVAKKEFKEEMEKFENQDDYGVQAPVCYTINSHPIETGLMMFKSKWVQKSDFINRYNWKMTRQQARQLDNDHRRPEERIKDICGKGFNRFFDGRGGRLENKKEFKNYLYLTHANIKDMVAFYKDTK